MNILFLDDCPHRHRQFRSVMPFAIMVHTADETIAKLSDGTIWDYVFLDHDLGGESFVNSNREDTGMGVVRWLAKNPITINKMIYVHSLNADGARKMVEMLRSSGYPVHYYPFTNLLNSEILDDIYNQ